MSISLPSTDEILHLIPKKIKWQAPVSNAPTQELAYIFECVYAASAELTSALGLDSSDNISCENLLSSGITDSGLLERKELLEFLQIEFQNRVSNILDASRTELSDTVKVKNLIQLLLKVKGVPPDRSTDKTREKLVDILSAEFRLALHEFQKTKTVRDMKRMSRFNPNRGFLSHKSDAQKKLKPSDDTLKGFDSDGSSACSKANFLSEGESRQRLFCRQCEFPCLNKRKSFCSNGCLHLYRVRSSGSYVRRCLLIRDRGICSSCKFDGDSTRLMLNRILRKFKGGLAVRRHVLTVLIANMKNVPAMVQNIGLNRRGLISGGQFWHADHIVAVCEGGGESNLEGYRTLCIACHKQVTASQRQLAAALRKRAREEEPQGSDKICLASTKNLESEKRDESNDGKDERSSEASNLSQKLRKLSNVILKKDKSGVTKKKRVGRWYMKPWS